MGSVCAEEVVRVNLILPPRLEEPETAGAGRFKGFEAVAFFYHATLPNLFLFPPLFATCFCLIPHPWRHPTVHVCLFWAALSLSSPSKPHLSTPLPPSAPVRLYLLSPAGVLQVSASCDSCCFVFLRFHTFQIIITRLLLVLLIAI